MEPGEIIKNNEKIPLYLIEALPYIREFKRATIVVKYGGNAMVEESAMHSFAEDIVLMHFLGIKPVVVHGGGPKISEMMNRLGKVPVFHDGLRITDKETVDIAEMVMTGAINKQIVALINRHGGKAVGLSGKDGQLIQAKKLPPRKKTDGTHTDFGFVGEVENIDPHILEVLDTNGFIPVISPLGTGEDGHAYNINADYVAAAIAIALKAKKLMLMTNVPGVMSKTEDSSSLISSLSLKEIDQLIADNIISGGMLPKVDACIKALQGGVHKTHIIDGRELHALLREIFTNKGIGTEIYV